MSYSRSTFSSRRRARLSPHEPSDEPHSAHHVSGTAHPRNNNDSHCATKRPCKDDRRVPYPHEEELRLSQELTSQCDAVVQRVHALLGRAQQCEESIQRTLQASLDRSPSRHASRSPQPTTRWSGLFSTPKAPPPTPADPTENSNNHANSHNKSSNSNSNTADAATTTGWISRVLWGASERQPSPQTTDTTPVSKTKKSPRSAEKAPNQTNTHETVTCSPPPAAPAEQRVSLFQRTAQRLSGQFFSPPPDTESPRRSRKSVAFKEPTDLVTLTPPRLTSKTSEEEQRKEDMEPLPRGSLVYPPAPPPSARKESRSQSNEEEKTEKAPDPNTTDVGAIIREFSQARAIRELTKADLLTYAKQHHISVSMSSTKKEIFEVVRRLAKDNAKNTK